MRLSAITSTCTQPPSSWRTRAVNVCVPSPARQRTSPWSTRARSSGWTRSAMGCPMRASGAPPSMRRTEGACQAMASSASTTVTTSEACSTSARMRSSLRRSTARTSRSTEARRRMRATASDRAPSSSRPPASDAITAIRARRLALSAARALAAPTRCSWLCRRAISGRMMRCWVATAARTPPPWASRSRSAMPSSMRLKPAASVSACAPGASVRSWSSARVVSRNSAVPGAA